MELLLDRFPALGTAWWVEATLPKGIDGEALKNELIAHLTTFEARYSRFRNDSLVGRLNRDRAFANPDQAFMDILRYGQSLYGRTEGTFNFLLGSTLTARGYGTGPSALPGDIPPHPEHDLEIRPDGIVLHAGGVDFGGFGKGYLVDLLSDYLKTRGVSDFLINGGGDLYGTSDNGTPISIHLEHPTEHEVYLGTTTLFNEGFAASSPFKRTWKQGDTTHNHIVGETVAASFVKAKTAKEADAFATAALLTPEDAIAPLATCEGLGIATFVPATGVFTAHHFNFIPS